MRSIRGRLIEELSAYAVASGNSVMAKSRILLALCSLLAVCCQPSLSQVSTEDKPACRGVFDFLFVIDRYSYGYNVLSCVAPLCPFAPLQ